jgi:hypothetical protein
LTCAIEEKEFDETSGIILITLLMLVLIGCFGAWGWCTYKEMMKPPEAPEQRFHPEKISYRGPRDEGADIGVVPFWHKQVDTDEPEDTPWDIKAKASFLSESFDNAIKMTTPAGGDQSMTCARAMFDHLKAKSYVTGKITLSAVDYNALDARSQLKAAVEKSSRKTIASALHTSVDNVFVRLYPGFKIEYTIVTSSRQSPQTMALLKSSITEKLPTNFERNFCSIPDIGLCLTSKHTRPEFTEPTAAPSQQGEYDSDWKAKLAVTRAKFTDPQLADALKQTESALLLEHIPEIDVENEWSDNFDGEGLNKYGVVLMLVRDELAGTTTWTDKLKTFFDLETGNVKESHLAEWHDLVRTARHRMVEATFHSGPQWEAAEETKVQTQAYSSGMSALEREAYMLFPVPGWTRIAHSEARNAIVLDLPLQSVIKLAEGGTRVRIQRAGRPSDAVQSRPRTYPIENLRHGERIGCGRELRREDVDSTWICNNPNRCAILDCLWHAPIPPSGLDVRMDKCLYEAKENTKGLVWNAGCPISMPWDGQMSGPQKSTNLEVFVDSVETRCLHIKIVSVGANEARMALNERQDYIPMRHPGSSASVEKVEYWFNENKATIATGTGINICMIDPHSEKMVTFWYEARQADANDRIVDLIEGRADGTLLLLGIKGSGLEILNDKAKEALRSCGCTLEVFPAGQSYALIGCKGGFALDERIGAEAANPGAAGFIQMCPGLGAQHNWAIDMKPESGNSKDTCKGKKMPPLYKGGGAMNHV